VVHAAYSGQQNLKQTGCTSVHVLMVTMTGDQKVQLQTVDEADDDACVGGEEVTSLDVGFEWHVDRCT
jgi:hypothetical protein